MAAKGTAAKSASGASMSKYDVEVEKRLKEIKSFDQSVSKRLDALEPTIEDQKEQINALQRRVGSGGDATIVADVEELRKQVELLGD